MRGGSLKFLDTNILVYEWDERDPGKQEIARKLVRDTGGEGVISSQVLQEFAAVMRSKLRASPAQIRSILASYRGFYFVHVDFEMVELALESAEEHGLNFWDSLIVEAAARAGCKTLYTEDLSAGQTVRGVKIANPFAR